MFLTFILFPSPWFIFFHLCLYFPILKSKSPDSNLERNHLNVKYILLWTRQKKFPFIHLREGFTEFTSKNCAYTNCFLTTDRDYLEDLTKYDAVLFNVPEVFNMTADLFPLHRSPRQKYVFTSIESSDYNPICDQQFNGYFNWTWTYKMNSDAMLGYIVIRDSNGHVVGPKPVMHWMKQEDMDPVDEELIRTLKAKTKLAAWFVSNCNTVNKREVFGQKLRKELKKLNPWATIDIYGYCGTFKCSQYNVSCDALLERDYYFYLAFENSFSEDYVTEKLLRALTWNVVPIVFGGANYSRFMPDHAYINARELGPKKLATTMMNLMLHPDKYAEYFRWKNHYYYHNRDETRDANNYCDLCALLNDEQRMNRTSVYEDLQSWWNEPSETSMTLCTTIDL